MYFFEIKIKNFEIFTNFIINSNSRIKIIKNYYFSKDEIDETNFNCYEYKFLFQINNLF